MKEPLALDLREVSVSFDRRPALVDVDLQVEQGTFLGLIGPNGGGKSVLLKVILGLLVPDGGHVEVLGLSASEARGQVAYVPQFARFALDFPIRVVDVVLTGRLGRRGLLERAHSEEDRDVAFQALQRVLLDRMAYRKIGELSGGELQRVLIARALAMEGRILLLDEPAASLDPGVRHRVHELLRELAPEQTVVMVSHDVGMLSTFVDSVACLNQRLYHHAGSELTRETIEKTYGHGMGLLLHTHEEAKGEGEGEAKGEGRVREPEARSQEPGAGSREPGAGSREPGAGSREPGDA